MITEIVILAASGVFAVASAYYGRDPKVNQCISGFSQCMSSNQPEERCNKILNLCKKEPKEKKEDDAGNN